nr:hypothetical protein [Tanacetum cinerariifolium]
MIEKKVITKPIDYATLNQLLTYFNTRFLPQTESYAEQAFWSQYSVQTDEPTHSGTTIVEVPKELPKVSMELFTSFDQCLIDEVTEVQKIFKQMELAVEQHYAEKTKFQTKMENVLKENDRLLRHALSVEIVNIVVNDCVNVNCLNMDACEHCVTAESELKTDFIKKEYYETLLKQYHSLEKHCISLEVNNQLNTEIFQRDIVSSSESAPTFAKLFETNELKAQIQEMDTLILKLKEKIKSFNGDVDVVPLVLILRKNMTAHIDYIRHTQEEAATLRELVESEILLSPLNTSLAYACKYTRRIQELLMILQQTCPRITDLGTNLVAVTPKNQTKQVRRTAQITKSEKIYVAISPSPNIDFNTPVLSSTRVALVSSASGSQSQDNTKKNRIRRTHKKAKETELEDHLRNIKSSLNKASFVNSRATSSVIKFVSNVNSNLKYASCNGCLFFDNHDACVVEYINYVNASRKSKYVKKPVKRKVWKSTGKVFKTVGYKWKPTGRILHNEYGKDGKRTRVNAASAPVTVVGPNSTNSTNSINAAGPSNNAVSPTFEIGGKSSFVDPS